MSKRLTKQQLKASRAKHEVSLREQCPDLSDAELQEELDVMEIMEASYPVATLTCACGRVHEIECTPAEYGGAGFTGNYCACGHKVHFDGDAE